MPTSKITLPDINVWVALVSDRHVHHRLARDWLTATRPGGTAFCRVTQTGLLRLLTNSRVMAKDALNQRGAWSVFEQLAGDLRVLFAPEPPDIELVWKKLTQSSFASTPLWTAALAFVHNFQVVSFDKGFKKIGGLNTSIL